MKCDTKHYEKTRSKATHFINLDIYKENISALNLTRFEQPKIISAEELKSKELEEYLARGQGLER